jgi:hypothetical protein
MSLVWNYRLVSRAEHLEVVECYYNKETRGIVGYGPVNVNLVEDGPKIVSSFEKEILDGKQLDKLFYAEDIGM